MSHISPPGTRSSRTWQRIDQAADTVRPRPEMQLACGGSLIRIKSACRPAPVGRITQRGIVTGFSAQARKRLLDLLASIDKRRLARLPLFITLTYPAVWPEDPQVWKEHLDAFFKRLNRKLTRTAAIWKLEFQSRGAPHFHILCFGPRWIDARWLARAWYKIVGSGDKRHLQAGVEVRRVKSWKGVMSYAAKYVAKKTVEGEHMAVGRWWGVYCREYLPFDLITLPMEFHQFFLLRRLLVRWFSARRGAMAGKKGSHKKPWKPSIGGDWQGLSLYEDALAALPLLRVLA